MKNISYLFGAGASCGALPLNNQITERLETLIEKITRILFQEESILENSRLTLLNDLTWLFEESQNHASVDTFAKKLYIKQQWDELKRLRLVLSVFFTCEQLAVPPDKRYDAFFASILDSSITSLPKNLKVLTWNYDYQFELSLSSFGAIKNVQEAHAYLGCIEKYKSYRYDNYETFKLIKLNGDISLRQDGLGSDTFPLIEDLSNPLTANTLRHILRNWSSKRSNGKHFCSNISFAWEKENSGFFDYVKQTTNNSEILVVIGYSFPFFNRSIDQMLITNMSALRKVYIQGPDANELAEKFKSLDSRTFEIVPWIDKNLFLIPNEM
jgi:hypothetical protein